MSIMHNLLKQLTIFLYLLCCCCFCCYCCTHTCANKLTNRICVLSISIFIWILFMCIFFLLAIFRFELINCCQFAASLAKRGNFVGQTPNFKLSPKYKNTRGFIIIHSTHCGYSNSIWEKQFQSNENKEHSYFKSNKRKTKIQLFLIALRLFIVLILFAVLLICFICYIS